MLELNDASLMAMLQDGDRKALQEIYRRHSAFLFSYAYKRLRSWDDSKDMIQDLFLNLWIKRQQIYLKGSLGAYLTLCLRNKIIDSHHSRTVRAAYLLGQMNENTERDNSTTEQIGYNELVQTIQKGINKLPPKMQQIYRLRKVEDRKIEEIASELDISVQTVKNQLSTALKKLRLSLGEYIILFIVFFFHAN